MICIRSVRNRGVQGFHPEEASWGLAQRPLSGSPTSLLPACLRACRPEQAATDRMDLIDLSRNAFLRNPKVGGQRSVSNLERDLSEPHLRHHGLPPGSRVTSHESEHSSRQPKELSGRLLSLSIRTCGPAAAAGLAVAARRGLSGIIKEVEGGHRVLPSYLVLRPQPCPTRTVTRTQPCCSRPLVQAAGRKGLIWDTAEQNRR